MNSKGWLVRRAALAIALMVGFYVLAGGIAAGLLWIPYAEWEYVGRVHLKLAVVCIGAGGAVLWAILPRIDRFEPPGPRLEERSCPDLFRLIHDVARETGQEVPADVYLVNEVNAWVTHRGGIMGFGSRRVMGIGLPLLQGVSEQELKAIIAHEFGHYASGDVSLGPWIYKTRAAIGRAIESMGEDSWLQIPFNAYGKLFLRVTHAVSRQQEFIADQIAAKVAGVAAASSALRQVTALAPVYHAYMSNEVAAVMNAGFLPPVASGFREFLQDDRTAGLSRFIVQQAETEDTTDPFDTHPSLRQRLEALGLSPKAGEDLTIGPGSAAKLIPNPDMLATVAFRHTVGADTVDSLKPVDWTAVAESVHAPQWRALANRYTKWLARFTPDTLPTEKNALIHAGSALVDRDEENVNSEERIDRAIHLLGTGLGVLLLDQGWQLTTAVGKPLVLTRGGELIDPFGIVHGLAHGQVDAAEWKARCSALGIAGRVLGATQEAQV